VFNEDRVSDLQDEDFWGPVAQLSMLGSTTVQSNMVKVIDFTCFYHNNCFKTRWTRATSVFRASGLASHVLEWIRVDSNP
jgi:hypothetical protein